MRFMAFLGCIAALFALNSTLSSLPEGFLGEELSPTLLVSEVPTALSADRQTARDKIAVGDIQGSVAKSLASLRSLPLDKPEVLGEAIPSLQVLSFSLCSLMTDSDLQTFLNTTLAPEVYPVDGLVRLYFYREFKDYSSVRPDIPLPEDATIRQEANRLATSSHALVRAGALFMLADPGWVNAGDNALTAIPPVMNALAELCPDAEVTKEAFRRLVKVCSGKAFDHPEAVKLLFDAVPWNAQVQALIASDPGVQVVKAALAETDAVLVMKSTASTTQLVGVSSVQQAAVAHADPQVRDFCLRLLATTNSLSGDHPTPLVAPITETYYVAAERVGEPIAGTTLEKVSVDTARAEFTLLANAIEDGDLAAAAPLVNVLMQQERDSEPLDVNLFERIPRKVNFYGLELVKQGRYDEAITVFEQLCQRYPNSWFASEWQEHIDHLRSLPR